MSSFAIMSFSAFSKFMASLTGPFEVVEAELLDIIGSLFDDFYL